MGLKDRPYKLHEVDGSQAYLGRAEASLHKSRVSNNEIIYYVEHSVELQHVPL